VLCVDNVNLACNEDDIRAYVSSLGAEVFTCFKTNPRRRPNESAGFDIGYSRQLASISGAMMSFGEKVSHPVVDAVG